MKTKIILTVGCVGKTYVDSNYINIYDFDKHTLDYKYDKTGFEHLSNEEFKSIPGRKIKENWFELYMSDWCKIIDSNKYDVVTGWLQDDAIEYLLNKGYELELILVDVKNHENVYKERSVQRGNNENYWNNLKSYYNSTLDKYKDRKDMKITIFTKPFYLSEYLLFSGTVLKRTNRFGHSYITKTKELVEKEFKTQNDYPTVAACSPIRDADGWHSSNRVPHRRFAGARKRCAKPPCHRTAPRYR